MDYIKTHHLSRPLAALTTDATNQPQRSLIIGSAPHRNDLQPHNEANDLLSIGASTFTTTTSTTTSKAAAAATMATLHDASLSQATTTTTSSATAENMLDNLNRLNDLANDEIWRKIVYSMESANNILHRIESNDTFLNPLDGSSGNFANLLNMNATSNGNGTAFYSYYDALNVSGNNSGNFTLLDEEFPWEMVPMIGTAVVLGLLILTTIIGNVFVIAAILLERNLQNVANYLILSLAVADLLVACLVMPLGAVYEVSHEWTLGPELCDMWTSSDVLCCTASILHLVAIALDRYWAVTNIDYIHHRTAKRIGIMILIVWCVAFMVCIAPLLGWKDPGWSERIEDNKCIVSQDITYQIFATASSFYLPLMVILILYWRIFQTARKRIRRRQILTQAVETKDNPAMCGIAGGLAGASASGGIAAAVVTIIGRPLPTISETTTTAFTNVSSNNTSPERASCANGLDDPPTTTDGEGGGGGGGYQAPIKIRKSNKYSADSKRERKAAKTLAIITGAFVICWLPFFVMAVLLPIYNDLFEEYMISLFLWLGYFNSTLNPIIYTIFSPEFRHAFKKILFGRNYARRRQKQFNIKHFQ